MGISDRLNTLLNGEGGRVERVIDLGRSHEWNLYRAVLSGGRRVFVKAAAEPHGALRAECDGLRWLRAVGTRAVGTGAVGTGAVGTGAADSSGTVSGSDTRAVTGAGEEGLIAPSPVPVPVPEVLAADDATLVLPWLESEPAVRTAAERFGRELAALHADDPGGFGAPWPGFIGPLPLDNGPGERWPEWYARRRLEPYLRDVRGALGADGVRLIERVIDRIDEVAGPTEPPGRIHGDLWSGNVLWSGGRGLLIDPAAHGGHRETDLAMLALFGAPWLDRIIAAYDEVAPLAAGWEQRVPLHQLHPLLVHVVLFGGGYGSAALEAAHRVLSA